MKVTKMKNSKNTKHRKRMSYSLGISTNIKYISSPTWWCTPVVPVLERLVEEDYEYRASLAYRLTLPQPKQNAHLC